MRYKLNYQSFPKELDSVLSLAETFPSQRTAFDLWKVTEDILRKEGVWPRFPFFEFERSIFYLNENSDRGSLLYKRFSLWEDLILILPPWENFAKISIRRKRGYSLSEYDSESIVVQGETGRGFLDYLKMQLCALIIDKGEELNIHEF